MAQANDRLGILHQNLIDAGCDEATTKQCIEMARDGREPEMLPLLAQYKKLLLGTVRRGQKQIDCLDYLIYRIQRIQQKNLWNTHGSNRRNQYDLS